MNNIEKAIELLEDHIKGLSNIAGDIEARGDDELQLKQHYLDEIDNIEDALTYLRELVWV